VTVVVADTSPLNYPILIEAIDLLPRLYGRIVIPNEVLNELIDAGAPLRVSEWATKLPEWVEVRSAALTNDPTLSLLDEGERCAILLAHPNPRSFCRSTKPPEGSKRPGAEFRTPEPSAYFEPLRLHGSWTFRRRLLAWSPRIFEFPGRS
jgi:hypothetical protein